MRVVIAAGGTGGHMYPAIAYAKAFQRRDPGGDILFVGTGKAVEQKILKQEGFPVESIPVEGFVGKSLVNMLRAMWVLPQSLWRAIRILRSQHTDLVIGTGGYFSPPVVVAAWLLQIPRVILEPNAMPGLANRLLGPLANRIFLAFESAKSFFVSSKIRVIGTPIREAFVLGHPPALPQRIGHLLIFGGSQGAQAINSAMLDAVKHSAVLQKSVTLTHQTGADDDARVREGYGKLGVQADVQPFLFDMPKELAKADLVICRAGASTLAELAAYGKVGILIPFPHATHNHQEMNARAVEDVGAARMLRQADLTGPRLAEEIERFMRDIPGLQAMARHSWETRKVDATEQMVSECLALVQPA
ncbi:MAG: undecaprenyldiphospho-muramoylpentapeptide beta-N-acetylglucosaminyltransferase [Nitrospirota bacterium]|nr:undecaprenyldiphospho-muramoylpentapeptide beta-N-acetylglucosaminyltransferase [Nitrospirota bacterium]